MKRSTHINRKLVKRIALGLAVAAIAVPAAQGQTYSSGAPDPADVPAAQNAVPTDGPRAGGVSAGNLVPTTDGPRAGGVSAGDLAIAADGPRAGGVSETLLRIPTDGPRSGPSADQIRDAVVNTYTTDAPRSGPATVDLPQAAPVTGPSGFDWRDAGVGVAIGIAASLLLAAIVLLVKGRRERVPAF